MESLVHVNKINFLCLNTRRIKQKYEVLRPHQSYHLNSNPIIFLHGLCDTRKTWKLVAPKIVNKTGRKAYLLDARNHGESTQSVGLSFEALTQDLVDFMDDLGIQKALLVGHSMGGRTAINFALRHPERTEALVVEDMSPGNFRTGRDTLYRILYDMIVDYIGITPDTDADLSSAKENVLNFGLEFDKKQSTDCHKGNQLKDLDSKISDKKEDIFSPKYDEGAVDSVLENNFFVQDLLQKCAPFYGKALFLYGDASFFNFEKDYSVRKLFPKATIQKIQNAVHYIHVQHPEEFSEAVSHFVLLKDANMSKY